MQLQALKALAPLPARSPTTTCAQTQALASALVLSEVGEKPGPFSAPRPDLLESWARHSDSSSELAPVAAVVGGVVANHVIRAVSGVGEPIRNLVFFSRFDNNGIVENMRLL